MAELLISKLKIILTLQGQLLSLGEHRFESLKKKELDNVDALTKKEMLLLFDLESELKAFKEAVEEICAKAGYLTANLKTISEKLGEKQRNELELYQKAVFDNEKKMTQLMKKNATMMESLMLFPEIIRNSQMHIASDEGLGSRAFLNKKF